MECQLKFQKSLNDKKRNRPSWFNYELDKHNFLDLDKRILIKDFEKINQIADEIIEELKKTYYCVYIDNLFFINELCKMRNIYFKGYKRKRSENKRNIQKRLWK